MTIVYNGTDISETVELRALTFDERDGGRLPELVAEFAEEGGLWDSWAPAPGDTVEVTEDGAAPTGELTVRAVSPVTGGYLVSAVPLAAPDERRTQEWKDAPFKRVAAQVASQLGLALAMRGCPEVEFARFSQDNESGLSALTRAAALCGCLLDVHGGTLTVYGREWAEAQASCGELDVDEGDRYSFSRRETWGSCELAQTPEGGRREIAATAGAGSPVLRAVLPATAAVASSAALEAMAAGVLAHANAARCGGWREADGLCGFTPGSVVDVECGPAPSMSGAGIVTRVRNDFYRQRSKVWWRPL